MAPFDPPPPSREYNQKRLVDIVRIGHDTLDKEHERLQEAILGVYNFQAIPSEPKGGKIYQYQIENQEQYDKHEVIITSALGTFEPVVNESKKTLFSLEMNIPQNVDYDMPPPKPITPEKDKPAEPDSRSFFDKLKGTKKPTRIITEDDPYQEGLAFLKDTMGKMKRFERFQEYQAYGIDLAIRSSFATMMMYLRFHRTRFKFEIAPHILRVHRQYIEIIKEREKFGAIKMGSKLDEEIFQTRNDFQLKQ